MSMVERYVKTHRQNKKYVKSTNDLPIKNFQHRRGWIDIPVDEELIYSHRNTLSTQL